MSRSSLVSSCSSTFHLVTVLQVRWKDFFTFTLSLSQVPQEFTGDVFYLHRVFLLPQLQLQKLRMNVFLCFFAQQIMTCFWTPTFGNIYMVSIWHVTSLFSGPSVQGKK